MITVNGWCAGGMGGGRELGDECSVNGGEGARHLCKLYPNFLKILIEGVVTIRGIGAISWLKATVRKRAREHVKLVYPARNFAISWLRHLAF